MKTSEITLVEQEKTQEVTLVARKKPDINRLINSPKTSFLKSAKSNDKVSETLVQRQ